MGTPAQLAMMEFPLFPVFLHAAVQTPPVPRDWAGLGKSACLPIIHLAALEREQSTRTYGLHGEESDRVCLFSTSSLSLSLVFSLSGTNTRGDFSQMAGPLNITRVVYPALVSAEDSSGEVWMTTHRRPVSARLFMSPSTSVFVHLALLRSTFSKPVSLPTLHFSTYIGMKIEIYLWLS